MANKMLIDAIHPEETRVVVVRGNRVEEFDFESASRKQLRGNIYLAKVTRVEPSLQAAFVDYGGNRHGFLAFSEIHPDYYQIPVADRQALIDEEARAHRDDDEDDDRRRGRRHRNRGARRRRDQDDTVHGEAQSPESEHGDEPAQDDAEREAADMQAAGIAADDTGTSQAFSSEPEEHPRQTEEDRSEPSADAAVAGSAGPDASGHERPEETYEADASDQQAEHEPHEHDEASEAQALSGDNGGENGHASEDGAHEDEGVEDVGGAADAMEEVPVRAPRYRRHYKIQEVIKRRQVMLVQVVKEERGTKGAALTTYLSLAGRYSVLMPNTARGGGISRKITSAEDRKRMKEIAEELQVPEGMGVILRTAGASRTNAEIQRDFEYLLRLWETVRDLTLKSTAPTLVYEEGSLVKRSIRDLYHKDIDGIIVEGDAAYQEARDFMRMLMPSHVSTVQRYTDPLPLFTRYNVEPQLDAMFQPTVQLKSGGYVVLNQTEALVAIDVNSGRATREHSIEETALKTNSEAAVEIARQLRLRDLAGLIVIDFIDMDEKRNNRIVERKLKEALKNDRARIQVGRISHFGLLEMSRQRIRTSVLESSTEACPHCGGTGHVRSVSSVALQLLRALDETLMKGATHNLIVRTRADVAIYVLNHKRAHLRRLEERFHVAITITTDPTMTGQPAYAIDRGEQVMSLEQARAIAAQFESAMPRPQDEEIEPVADEDEGGEETEAAGEGGEREERDESGGRRRRRRGRRGRGGRGREDREQSFTHETVAEHTVEHGEDFEAEPEMEGAETAGEPQEGESRDPARKRRRGRRGGRRNRRSRDGEPSLERENGHETFAAGDFDESPEPEQQAVASPGEEMRQPARELAPPEPPAAPPSESPAPEQAPPRRRSTVREPAPIFDAGSGEIAPPPPPPPPAPVATESEDATSDKPRRAGWWSRRG